MFNVLMLPILAYMIIYFVLCFFFFFCFVCCPVSCGLLSSIRLTLDGLLLRSNGVDCGVAPADQRFVNNAWLWPLVFLEAFAVLFCFSAVNSATLSLTASSEESVLALSTSTSVKFPSSSPSSPSPSSSSSDLSVSLSVASFLSVSETSDFSVLNSRHFSSPFLCPGCKQT